MATAQLERERTVTTVPQYFDVRHPPGLPPGSVRRLLCLMIAGLMVFQLLQPPGSSVQIPLALYGLLAMILIFVDAHGGSVAPARSGQGAPWWLLGRLLHAAARRSWWFQDVLAWVVLLAMTALTVGWVLLAINPTLDDEFDLTVWQSVLTGLVTLYFAARS